LQDVTFDKTRPGLDDVGQEVHVLQKFFDGALGHDKLVNEYRFQCNSPRLQHSHPTHADATAAGFRDIVRRAVTDAGKSAGTSTTRGGRRGPMSA
jgi:hypothetical protein